MAVYVCMFTVEERRTSSPEAEDRGSQQIVCSEARKAGLIAAYCYLTSLSHYY